VGPRSERGGGLNVEGIQTALADECCSKELAAWVGHESGMRYWITWSARWSSDCGIVRPSALAVANRDSPSP
jgi:hypothetical protein